MSVHAQLVTCSHDKLTSIHCHWPGLEPDPALLYNHAAHTRTYTVTIVFVEQGCSNWVSIIGTCPVHFVLTVATVASFISPAQWWSTDWVCSWHTFRWHDQVSDKVSLKACTFVGLDTCYLPHVNIIVTLLPLFLGRQRQPQFAKAKIAFFLVLSVQLLQHMISLMQYIRSPGDHYWNCSSLVSSKFGFQHILSIIRCWHSLKSASITDAAENLTRMTRTFDCLFRLSKTS